jgi:2-C-methyl-D-erythritol 2,4-cyclodiphosphate synthase
MIRPMARGYRVGQGVDLHRFRRGAKLVLCGVEVPHRVGLAGHSDADVALHALMNALLGAIGRGDIGTHFPDDDPRYRGASSAALLAEVLAMVRGAGYALVNADLTLLAEEPKLAPHFPRMRESLGRLLGVGAQRINLKAGTFERIGALGRGDGMAAMAVVLLRGKPKRAAARSRRARGALPGRKG